MPSCPVPCVRGRARAAPRCHRAHEQNSSHSLAHSFPCCVRMQSYPGFAERAEAAFGAALGRDGGAWRVATTVAPFSAGGEGSESGEEGEEGAPAFCKAFEAEPEEAEEDILARAASSPPHLVELGDADERRAASPAGRVTVYVLDEPLYVGSGAQGEEREAVQPPELLRRGADDSRAGARPPPEPPKFQGVSHMLCQQQGSDAERRCSQREKESGCGQARRRGRLLWRWCRARQATKTWGQTRRLLQQSLRTRTPAAHARSGRCAAKPMMRTREARVERHFQRLIASARSSCPTAGLAGVCS